ncbi:MAG TPA: periplasmic heavy metal sensor [Hyphomicrobiaceae bacterium]|jgi:uncharacterized membrane protein|nr:periplasmic heavy metal sensor [Hyphomicrobiaceae bacterium]
MTETAAGWSQPRAGTSRRLLVVLVASLALNLIVVGLVAGAAWRFRGMHWVGHAITPNLLGYASTLPTDRRRALWNSIAEKRRHMQPLRRELRNAREEAIKALTAEPFDKQRFLAAQTQLLHADQQAREAVYGLYAEIATQMTPEERRAFLHWRAKQRAWRRNLLDEPEQQAKEPAH